MQTNYHSWILSFQYNQLYVKRQLSLQGLVNGIDGYILPFACLFALQVIVILQDTFMLRLSAAMAWASTVYASLIEKKTNIDKFSR